MGVCGCGCACLSRLPCSDCLSVDFVLSWLHINPNALTTWSTPPLPPCASVDSPDVRHTAVGGFYFLRYICPALASPHTHALCEVRETEPHSFLGEREQASVAGGPHSHPSSSLFPPFPHCLPSRARTWTGGAGKARDAESVANL